MRSSELGFAVVLGVAGLLALVGLAIFPPGKLVGAWPAVTAWGPGGVVVLGVLGLWVTAAVFLLGGVARPVSGEVIFESDGGFVALALAVLPLAVGPLFLAGAVDQIGRYGAHGVVWAVVCGGAGLGFGVAGIALGYTRDEVRLGDGVITVIAGRGLPSVESWQVKDVALEVTKVVMPVRTSWKVELVVDGQRRVVGRVSTQAEAEALAARIRTGS